MANLDHELRAKGIGSSEIAMLVIGPDGKPLSRWGGPHKLWRIKTGVELPREDDDLEKPWLERGNALEPWILSRYASVSGARIRRSPGTIRHKKFPYVVDSVDALAWMPGDGKAPSTCVEAKAPLRFSTGGYGEEGTDQIDQQYLVQGQWHMGAWELPRCDYPIDLSTGDVKIYSSEHDQELWESLLLIAERFWVDHVEAGVPPEPDGTEETSAWLSRRLAQKDEDIIDADEDLAQKMVLYRELRLALDRDADVVAKLANEIKAGIGEHKGICVPGCPKARATFTEQNGRKSFDHNAYIQELMRRYLPENEAPPDRAEYYSRGKPYRVFRVQQLLKHEVNR